MAVSKFDFVEGDTGSELIVECRDKRSKQPIDLTNKTATLKFRVDDGPLFQQLMTIDVPETQGIARYQFKAGELVNGKLVSAVVITDTATGAFVTQLDPFVHLVRKPI